MPEFELVSPAYLSAIKRPVCPKCRRRMLLSRLGFGTCTFECQRCGYASTKVVSSDPMTSDVLGWLASELRPPT